MSGVHPGIQAGSVLTGLPAVRPTITGSHGASIPFGRLAVTIGVQMAAAVMLSAMPALAPAVALDLGLHGTAVGRLTPIAFGVSIPAALLSSGLVRRYGGVRMLQTVLLATAGMIIAAACAHGMPGLLVATIMLGLGYGVVMPAGTQVLVPSIPRPVFNLVMSLRQLGVPLGGVAAAIILPPLGLMVGWRTALLCWLVPILLLLLLLETLRRKWDIGREPKHTVFGRRLLGSLQLLQDPGVRRLTCVSFTFAGAQFSLGSFMVLQLTTTAGFTLIQAGYILAAFQMAGLVSRPVWGWISDRFLTASSTLVLMAPMIAASVVLAGRFGPTWPVGAILGVAVLAGISANAHAGISQAEYVRLAPESRTEATGLCSAMVYLGGLVIPAAFSWLVAFTGTFAFGSDMIAVLVLASGVILGVFRATATVHG